MKSHQLIVLLLILAAAVCAGCLEGPDTNIAPAPTPVVEEHWASPVGVVACCGEAGVFPASASIDGNRSTAWGHTKGEAHWIIYDLGSAKEIDKVRIYADSSYGGAPCRAFIYMSDNKTALLGENKTEYGGAKGRSERFRATLAWNEIELANGGTSRSTHIRISNPQAHAAGTSRLEDSMNSSICQFRRVVNSFWSFPELYLSCFPICGWVQSKRSALSIFK